MLKTSVAAYEKKAPLSGDDLVNVARLLGLTPAFATMTP